MRHIITLLVLLVGGYFAWFYLPADVKATAREFMGTHLFKVLLLIFTVVLLFALQAAFGSAKFF